MAGGACIISALGALLEENAETFSPVLQLRTAVRFSVWRAAEWASLCNFTGLFSFFFYKFRCSLDYEFSQGLFCDHVA